MRCYLLAAEVGLEEATQSTSPTRKSCAAGKRSSRWGRVVPQDGVRQASALPTTLAYPTPPSCLPWLICSRANCKAFWVSECPHSHPPPQNTLCPRLSSPHACAVLRAPRNTWPSPSRVSAPPHPVPHPGLWHSRCSFDAGALVPCVQQKDSGSRGQLQPGAGGASFWARCAA